MCQACSDNDICCKTDSKQEIKYGSEFSIVLLDPNKFKFLYEEPFKLDEYNAYLNFDKALDSFKDNAQGAISDILRDIEQAKKYKDISNVQLLNEVARRGLNK